MNPYADNPYVNNPSMVPSGIPEPYFFEIFRFDLTQIGPKKISYLKMISEFKLLHKNEREKILPRFIQTIAKILPLFTLVLTSAFVCLYASDYLFPGRLKNSRFFSVILNRTDRIIFLPVVLGLLYEIIKLANTHEKAKVFERAENKWNSQYSEELKAFRQRRQFDDGEKEEQIDAEWDNTINDFSLYPDRFQIINNKYDEAIKYFRIYKKIISRKNMTLSRDIFSMKSYLDIFDGK